MKAIALIALALALEAGFLLTVAAPPGATPAPGAPVAVAASPAPAAGDAGSRVAHRATHHGW